MEPGWNWNMSSSENFSGLKNKVQIYVKILVIYRTCLMWKRERKIVSWNIYLFFHIILFCTVLSQFMLWTSGLCHHTVWNMHNNASKELTALILLRVEVNHEDGDSMLPKEILNGHFNVYSSQWWSKK